MKSLRKKIDRLLRKSAKAVFEGFANPENQVGMTIRIAHTHKRNVQRVK